MSLFERKPPDPRVVADPRRLPPGQVLTEKWPVLHHGSVPAYSSLDGWRLRITGAVQRELAYSHQELRSLPADEFVCDIHCVTTWSRFDNRFTGIRLSRLLDEAGARGEAGFVIFRCAAGFTTSIPMEVARDPQVGVTWAHDGRDLSPEHGWPLRALVPSKYFWKSAKWLEEIVVSEADELGFWERNGYNNAADPWREERYW